MRTIKTLNAGRVTMLLQYWQSHEDLMRFAHSSTHMKAWREYYQDAHESGAVGIWHETYCVEPGKFETGYANMPLFGLAKATKTTSAVGRLETAKGRIQRD